MSVVDEKKGQDPVKWVGSGLDAPQHSPADPQAYLQGSNHPYSPFTGNAMKWESYVFDDGTTYEGLMREMIPHGMGVLVMGNGYGGGLQNCQRGDRYEGEFYAGFAHGLGHYISPATSEVYRGEFSAGKRNGCGVLTDMSPFHKLVDEGVEPNEAWEQAKPKVESGAKWGTWNGDYFVSGPDESGKFCAEGEIKGVLQELESVVTKARMWEYKPDGDVTISTAQDAEGKPVNLMQDPLHYPHGTKFLAPGPLGQCHPLPNDPKLLQHMAKVQRNYDRVYNGHNFDAVTQPGSDMEKAEKLWNKLVKDLQKEKKRQEKEEKRRLKSELDQKPAEEEEEEPAKGKGKAVAKQDDIDDDDLIASIQGVSQQRQQVDQQQQQQGGAEAPARWRGGPGSFSGGSAFGSVALSASRASNVIGNALEGFARRADRRRSLTRPARC